MNLLILGGGVFLGAAALQSALTRGHQVTVFNRGRARSVWPAGVEVLTGDRSTELGALQGHRWDAVIDTCGYVPADVQASAEALSGCSCYLFVSSISVYATTTQVPVREADALAPFDQLARDDRKLEHYGAQKAACEAEVQRVFCKRALIVRPGLIVGPGDRSGRFSHWPWRVMVGGDMLVPDAPPREPLQFIDVRDLGEWMLRLLETNQRGVFNATGPVSDYEVPVCDWPALLRTCTDAVAARGLAPARGVPVAEAFLVEQGVQPWSELPLWLPSADPEYAGFSRVDLSRVRAAGLRTRSLRETVDAVLDEGQPAPDDKRRTGKLTRDKEVQLLAAWAGASVGH
jgi:2'-hydroxyisoflavone reductase